MQRSTIRSLSSLLLGGVLLAAQAAASAQAPAHARIDPPPSAQLDYAIKANQKGLPLDGSATVQWHTDGKHYSVRTETHAMLLGKILDAQSEGSIDSFGLAPSRATEKRFHKEETVTTFDRQHGKVTYSASAASSPLKDSEQDRNSITWQLASMARAGQFKPGDTVSFTVAGPKDADIWTFKVGREEKISTPLGALQALQLSRIVKDDHGQKVDLWLAPSREWYPVRIRFTEPDGDYIEQTVENIVPATH